MKTNIKLCVAVGTLIVTSGCVVARPFNPDQPLEIQGSFLTRSFLQNGKDVGAVEVTNHLKNDEVAGEKAQASEVWFYASVVTAAIGGYVVGYNAFNQNLSASTQQTGIIAGVGIIGVAIATAAISDHYLVDAAQLYNQHLSKRRDDSRLWRVTPSLAVLNDGRNSCPGAGLTVAFP